MIHIRFFASLRERLGVTTLKYEYAGEHNIKELISHLVNKGESWQSLTEHDVLVAVNQTLCGKDANINDGDEIAFFPPVTGG